MSRELVIHACGPGVTLQDMGRTGYLGFGLSRGGAADRMALAEGAALLGQDPGLAALEMAGFGGTFEATGDIRIALTGARMRVALDGVPLAGNASHLLRAGSRLEIGPATTGVYGYLHVGGGIATEPSLGARATQLVAGIGAPLAPGDRLPVGDDGGAEVGLCLPVDSRFAGGTIRVVPGPQTGLFSQDEIDRFQRTTFTRDARGNRMGVRLMPDGEGFHSEAGLSVLSEFIVPGDIQITGDGTPFVLLAECQTTGGYPRIGSVLPSDLPIIAQAPPGARLGFRFLAVEEAVEAERAAKAARQALRSRAGRLVRDPRDIRDLLAYNLVDGVISAEPMA